MRKNLILPFLFILVGFFYLPNTHANPLLMTQNIMIWVVVAGLILLSLFFLYTTCYVFFPERWRSIFLFFFLILLSSIFSGFERIGDIFSVLAFVMGVCFFYSMFQFNIKRYLLETILFIVLIGLFLHAVVGFLQTLPGRPLYPFIPHPAGNEPLGMFMQRNNLASAMVTGIVLGLFLISTPGFRSRSLLLKSVVFTALFGCSMIVMMTGSRVGLLSFIIAVPVLLSARYRLLRLRPFIFALGVLALVTGSGVGVATSDGLWIATSKLERLADEGRDARQHIYAISWDVFTDQPLIGHGIGSFDRIFHTKAAEYLESKDGEPLIGHDRFTHPHNEILLWAIEGGALAVAGIVALIMAALMQLYRIGWQRGGAIAALLAPITLHTQVELPFYYSHYHWFLFLFLAYLLFRPFSKKNRLSCSRTSLLVAPLIGGVIFISVLIFCISTLKTSRDLTALLYYHDVNLEELRAAKSHPYFGDFATLLTHQTLLNSDLKNGTNQSVSDYIVWASNYLDRVPDAHIYHNLALAYYYIGNNEMMQRTVGQGLYLFPQHPVISSVYEKTKLFEPYSDEEQ